MCRLYAWLFRKIEPPKTCLLLGCKWPSNFLAALRQGLYIRAFALQPPWKKSFLKRLLRRLKPFIQPCMCLSKLLAYFSGLATGGLQPTLNLLALKVCGRSARRTTRNFTILSLVEQLTIVLAISWTHCGLLAIFVQKYKLRQSTKNPLTM